MQSAVDKAYALKNMKTRKEYLTDLYFRYCRDEDEFGREVKPQYACVKRSTIKRDMNILDLLIELAEKVEGNFYLSEEGAVGFEKLCEPSTKHELNRRYRHERI